MLFKFNKIRNKILFGYGLFILIIIIQVILSYYLNNKAKNDYENITKDIKPKVSLFNKYRNANNILILMVNNKVSNVKSGLLSNKIKQLSNVDLPYFRSELLNLKKKQNSILVYNQRIDSIVKNTKELESKVKDINNLLITKKDYLNSDKLIKAKKLLKNANKNFNKIDVGIAFLQKDYNKKSEQSYAELSNKIENSTQILLLATLFFIVLGLIFSYKITTSITNPLQNLMDGAKNVTKGKYNSRVKVYGNDEIAELALIFNKMSISLNRSFNDIRKKNRELEQFTYIASHDLQEPLRTLTGFVNYLSENYGHQFDEIGQKSLGYISDASERMSLLVKSLLEHSKIGKNKKLTIIDCNKLLEEVKKDLTAAIEESNAIINVADLPQIKGYEVELRLLFQNLISNAIKFRKTDISPIIDITVKEKIGWTFAIKDNGIGFEQKHEKRIFSVFQRLHYEEKYEGTGIGLAHCSKIIELHTGTIWAKSKPNEGSTFYFNIPNKKS